MVAILLATADAWMRYREADQDQDRVSEMQRGYECAAKFRDEDLLKARAKSDNINVGLSPFECARRNFWVSMHEIKDVRNGRMYYGTPNCAAKVDR